MTALKWDQTGDKVYEAGVDHGVLYLANNQGVYDHGYAWNGLVTVTESPSGAEASAQFADNIKYLNLVSAEEFSATIEAFTYPDQFAECDGSASLAAGVYAGQQPRRPFGLSFRTLIGNDIAGQGYGYKLHLVYGCLAAPSEKAFGTINDSPEAITFSWEVSTTPVDVPGFKPTAELIIDSTKTTSAKMQALEELLYGTEGVDAALPTPAEVVAVFGTQTLATPTAPSYNSTTKVITIPSVTGVVYQINGVTKAAGALPAITADTVVTAKPALGYKFPAVTDDDWLFTF